MFNLLILFLVALSGGCAAQAQEATEFSAKVIGITDGDTISVLHDGVPEKIRLHGIDCPEKKQAFGTKAKQVAGELAFEQMVTLRTHGKDRYGRTIAEVILRMAGASITSLSGWGSHGGSGSTRHATRNWHGSKRTPESTNAASGRKESLLRRGISGQCRRPLSGDDHYTEFSETYIFGAAIRRCNSPIRWTAAMVAGSFRPFVVSYIPSAMIV